VNKLGAAIMALLMGFVALAAIVPSASAAPYESYSWIGDLSEPRHSAAAAAGLDDKIYMIGGFDSGWNIMSSVLIFDPVTGETSYGASMPTGVWGAAAVRVANGSLLVFGGYSSLGTIQGVQIYDPVADSWSIGPVMPKALYWVAACVGADSRVYVFGGVESTGDPGNSTMILNTVSNSWSYGDDLLTPRWGSSAVLIPSGSMMLIGGATSAGAHNVVETYDPVADSWSSGENLSNTRTVGGAVAARNGQVYYFGGQYYPYVWSYDSEIYSSAERLDLSGGVPWETIGGIHVASFGMCVDSYDRAFIVGGWDGTNARGEVYVWVFAEISSPYQVVITSPADGSIVSDAVTVEAEVVNWMGGGLWAPLMGIDLFVDGVLYESQAGGWSGSFVWDTTALADGSDHTLMVRGYHLDGKVVEDSVTVTVSSESVEESVAAIGQQLAGIQMQIGAMIVAMAEANASTMAYLDAQLGALQGVLLLIIQGMEDANASTMAYLNTQLNTLQGILTQIGNGLTAMGAGQTAAMTDLNATLADLQLQLDDFQEQIDRVENKADTAGTYGIVTMVLVIIIIALVALMLMMARKKP